MSNEYLSLSTTVPSDLDSDGNFLQSNLFNDLIVNINTELCDMWEGLCGSLPELSFESKTYTKVMPPNTHGIYKCLQNTSIDAVLRNSC